MLVLNRRAGEAIIIDGNIRVVVISADRRGVRIGIEAPASTNILREELVREVEAENRRAVPADGALEWVGKLAPLVPGAVSDRAAGNPPGE